jgi:phosphoenolpyruvate synthase/pyruvate phosphate dikinase
MAVESYVKYDKKLLKIPFDPGCGLSAKGILKIYRRKKTIRDICRIFDSIENKEKYLKEILKLSKKKSAQVEEIIASTDNEIKKEKTVDELVSLFKKAYQAFLEYCCINVFPIILDTSFQKTGQEEKLEKYKALLVAIRSTNQDTNNRLEKIINDLIRLIAKKLRIDVNLLFNSTPKEIISKKINIKEAKRRSEKYFIIGYKNEIEVIADKKKIALIQQDLLKLEKKSEDNKTFSGKVAYPGKITGRAVVVFKKEKLAKLKKGDILVTPMTEMDFVPYLKNISAIVTDEGGVTCHAAIIARELKKPCIIATKIVTQVLHDGDLVEVDANKGIVRILKRK